MAIADAKVRQELIDAIEVAVAAGIMSKSNHGNMSLRLPGTDTFLMTGVSSFTQVNADQLVVLDLQGNLVEGEIEARNAEVIQMHAVVYRERPEVGSVLHTHSPFATAFAVASRSLPLFYEAQVRNDILEGVPLAGYGPRGSDESVNNIAALLKAHDQIKGLLLENHGVLAFSNNARGAAQANIIIEETAQLALYAEGLGGPTLLTPERAGAAIQRRDTYEERGTQKA
jgi:L-ribulose-5-phosphate 4-epimerase